MAESRPSLCFRRSERFGGAGKRCSMPVGRPRSPKKLCENCAWSVKAKAGAVFIACCIHIRRRAFEISHDALARALGVLEASVKSLLHHFRIRYRALLREEIAKPSRRKQTSMMRSGIFAQPWRGAALGFHESGITHRFKRRRRGRT